MRVFVISFVGFCCCLDAGIICYDKYNYNKVGNPFLDEYMELMKPVFGYCLLFVVKIYWFLLFSTSTIIITTVCSPDGISKI